MTFPLFDTLPDPDAAPTESLADGATLLRGFALHAEEDILCSLGRVIEKAPLRHMVTPGGHRMSVAMTNCGDLGWISSHSGYRYTSTDPENGNAWPAMAADFLLLARSAAESSGFRGVLTNACLVNRYEVGARLTLHQDKDERDFTKPIVSVSLGLPASFLFGGVRRTDPVERIQLHHGDVVVWGGPSRLRFHGVAPIKRGQDARLGSFRYNLTFRYVG